MTNDAQAVDLSTSENNSHFESLSSKREQELLTLIHNLNECNDVLLSKASKLETALKASQQSVHSMVEGETVSQEKLAEQLSDQPVDAEQTEPTGPAPTMQQQVARLARQLATERETLQRQQLIQETIQAELDDAHARIHQLERECALVTQQHADEAQARIKSDTINRDLRSRLQRQQRYTLQFKAALEKSLSVKASPTVTASTASPPWFDEPNESSSVSMPRAERIVPWTAVGRASFTDIDPHLESLIRGQKGESPIDSNALEASCSEISSLNTCLETELERSSSATITKDIKDSVADAKADQTSWQGIERVMEVSANSIDDEPTIEAHNIPAIKAEAIRNAESVQSVDAEPPLDWQTEALPIDPTVSPAKVQSTLANDNLSASELDSEQAQTNQEVQQDQSKHTHTRIQSTDDVCLIDRESTTISPLLNPLRPQRKIDSLAAVQLPTFEKTEDHPLQDH
ncbi:hypothetical protein S7335_3096 [Synechococcus sp. PCC 7335]|nr:hypothetical protein S7335_3096 [Synechococcus sp. PCC 7335]